MAGSSCLSSFPHSPIVLLAIKPPMCNYLSSMHLLSVFHQTHSRTIGQNDGLDSFHNIASQTGGFNNRNLFFHSLEGSNPRSKC
jgi:hypothetical protein